MTKLITVAFFAGNMANKCLGCLEEDGNYSKKRIGMLILGLLFLGFFIWLIILSVKIGKIDDEHKGTYYGSN